MALLGKTHALVKSQGGANLRRRDFDSLVGPRAWVNDELEIPQGFRQVTFKELAHAVDAVAWEIEGRFNRSCDFATIAYIGIPDFRYTVVVFAAIKCGFTVCQSDATSEDLKG